MNKLTFVCILIFALLLACNTNNSTQENTISNDTDNVNIESNSQKEEIIETILSDDNIEFIDTVNYQQEEKNTNTEFKEQAIKLNDKAIELFSYFGEEPYSEQSVLLDSVLILLNKAIKTDSTYYLAYANKANILSKQKKYKEAIETLDIAVKIRENYAEGISMQGFLYEKIGMQEEANLKYKKAIQAYIARLNTPFKVIDRVNVQIDIAFMLMFTEDKQTALQVIDTIISYNPENKMAIFMKENIKIFNREEFISSF